MLLNIKKYNKLTNGQPELVETYNEVEAMVFQDDPIIDERIELTQFFEFTVPSMEFTLSKRDLSDEVKALLTTEGLKDNVIGIYFEQGNIKFDGYITPESVENSMDQKFYYITGINWWKYYYDEMANHYCPDVSDIISQDKISISDWLLKAVGGDIIQTVSVSIDNEWDDTTPYIRLAKYIEYGTTITIREMFDNLHRVLIGVFILEGSELTFTQTHKEHGSQDITELIENVDYSEMVYLPKEYNSALLFSFGQDYLMWLDGEIKTKHIPDDNKIQEQYNYLDLRQKIGVMGSEVLPSPMSLIKISDFVWQRNNVGDVSTEWIGMALQGVFNTSDSSMTIVTAVDEDTRQITVNGWKSLEIADPVHVEPSVGETIIANVYEITERNCENGEDVIKTGVYEMINNDPTNLKKHFYQTQEMLRRIFAETSLVLCNILSTAVSLLEKATIDTDEFRVFAASKNANRKVTTLELEKIG